MMNQIFLVDQTDKSGQKLIFERDFSIVTTQLLFYVAIVIGD